MQIEKLFSLTEALQKESLPFCKNEPLANHTTFQIGGPAAVFCRPETVVELTQILELCRQLEVRSYVLGNGSNILFSDRGFDGVVISMRHVSSAMVVEPYGQESLIHVSAGTKLSALCNKAQKHGLSGLEFAYGIPGTVGGAVYMNAGAYGGELRDVLKDVTFLDESLHLQTLPAYELDLGYRTSIFERKPWCIVEATVQLQTGTPQEIRDRMMDFMQRRREKQPLEMPSAGSTFKRPTGAFAGQLIEQCGLRGFAVGDAMVSTKHCGFVVNRGHATCEDVIRLTDEVTRIVFEKTGYQLEREIRVVE